MKSISFGFLAALALVSLMLQGCSSSSGGFTVLPGSRLTIGGDTAYTDRTAARTVATLSAPLAAGAVIDVYNFQTGVKLTSGQIGSDGFGTVNITPGMTVAIIITGTRAGVSYRLSTIIPSVPTADTELVADPATSLAAEAIAQQYFRSSLIDQGTFEKVLTAARNYLQSHPGASIALGGGLIAGGSTFGVAGALDATQLAAVIAAVPTVIDNKIVAAKNAVQQFKEVGLPLESVLNQERPNLDNLYASCTGAINNASLHTVLAKYNGLGDRLGTLLLPALFGNWLYVDVLNPTGVWGKSIFQFVPGMGYLVTQTPSYLRVTPNAAYNVADQITIVLVTPGGNYQLVAKMTSPSTAELRQTCTNDANMQYAVTATASSGDLTNLGTNPTFQTDISLADSQLTTPVTFNGTLSATGADLQSYTRIIYAGTLDSGEVHSGATVTVNFPSALPAGAPSEQSIYDFPTS
ncbi:MAG TPA: hypothetical protein VGM23_18680, partial [Armatimonadota bacterium]